MQKILMLLSYLFILNTITLFSQTDKSFDFWPYHIGDTWQYRKMSTNQIDHTVYIDSIKYDSLTKNTIIYEGGWGNPNKINTECLFHYNGLIHHPS